ncbi:MAG: hypothetical protein VX223_12005 [Myxococcota bacterium]|nr:hypothetical protein [Myxococcota bacterium]
MTRELAHDALHDRLVSFIRTPEVGDFNALALAVFEYQYNHIEVVRRVADYTGNTPDRVQRWNDIPAIPARAFKSYSMFDDGALAHTFFSSGTSGAPKSKAHFSEAGLTLMAESILQNARKYFLPEGRNTVILVLAPSPSLAPHMIMAWGMEQLIQHFGLPGSRFLVGPEGLDQNGLMQTFTDCIRANIPVTLIGASFGFVHLLDGLAAKSLTLQLPEGSRLMDAGGFKGRSRVVRRNDMDRAITETLAIPAHLSVNLLGMTELASQFYDDVLIHRDPQRRRKSNAPWTRTVVLDPRSMQFAAHGTPGLLCHWDLANLERPCAVLTDDLGVRDALGWTVLGRAKGVESKGCSLTIDAMLGGQTGG